MKSVLTAAGPVAVRTEPNTEMEGGAGESALSGGVQCQEDIPSRGEKLKNSPRSCRQKRRGHSGPKYFQNLLLSLNYDVPM